MAKSKPRPKLDEGAVYKLLHYLLFGLFLANVYVIYTFERDRRPQIVEKTITITTNTVVVVSNLVSAASLAGSQGNVFNSTTNAPNDKRFEIEVPYRMFITQGRRSIELGGRYFGEGAPTSYGRIAKIWPDRVALENGYFLKNKGFDARYDYDERPNQIYDNRRYQRDRQIQRDKYDDIERERSNSVIVDRSPDVWRYGFESGD